MNQLALFGNLLLQRGARTAHLAGVNHEWNERQREDHQGDEA